MSSNVSRTPSEAQSSAAAENAGPNQSTAGAASSAQPDPEVIVVEDQVDTFIDDESSDDEMLVSMPSSKRIRAPTPRPGLSRNRVILHPPSQPEPQPHLTVDSDDLTTDGEFSDTDRGYRSPRVLTQKPDDTDTTDAESSPAPSRKRIKPEPTRPRENNNISQVRNLVRQNRRGVTFVFNFFSADAESVVQEILPLLGLDEMSASESEQEGSSNQRRRPRREYNVPRSYVYPDAPTMPRSGSSWSTPARPSPYRGPRYNTRR